MSVIDIVAITERIEGLYRLHTAAILQDNSQLAEQYRDDIHASIDILLDARALNIIRTLSSSGSVKGG